MISGDYVFTSESVTGGHPDKLADALSDAFLDLALARASGPRDDVRTAVECFFTGSRVVVAGEVSGDLVEPLSRAAPDLAREVLTEAGYDESSLGVDPGELRVETDLKAQSEEIRRGTAEGQDGAGDQGMMFGYANRETSRWMPAPIAWAHQLSMRLAAARREGVLPWLRPDGKSQVSVRYGGNRPVEVEAVVLSAQHAPEVEGLDASSASGDERALSRVRQALLAEVVEPVLGDLTPAGEGLVIQPSGLWNHGGPLADTGLTGRKLMVDTYGARVPHGGGAFSGKDPTKVDRTGHYYARWAAVEALRRFPEARWVEVQVAYAIHGQRPIGDPYVRCRPKGLAPEVARFLREVDWSVRGMISELGLWELEYRPLAAYGHFGRPDLSLPWDPPRR